jgi:hypothetical protein
MSTSTPFHTLTHAQSAMRASATIKTTYVMAGTFNLTAALALDSRDAGESWLGYPGQTPVLDGGGTATAAITDSGGAGVVIRWLTVQNFAQNGIEVAGAANVTIDSNTLLNIASTNWNQGPIEVDGSFTGGKITHNLIRKAGYTGIAIHASAGNDISGALIDGNVVQDSMLTVADGGAIYVMDRAHASTGVVISHNVVGNHGTASNGSKGIYLDDLASHVTVTENVVYGTGQYGLQIHGGDHNVFENNVFDLSQGGKLGVYQDDPKWGNFGMAGNVFQCSIVYSSTAPPAQLWSYSVQGTASVALPTVSMNDYWGTVGTLPNTGTIVDTSPLAVDPKFVGAASANYAFQSGPPMSCFQSLDTTTAGPVAH